MKMVGPQRIAVDVDAVTRGCQAQEQQKHLVIGGFAESSDTIVSTLRDVQRHPPGEKAFTARHARQRRKRAAWSFSVEIRRWRGEGGGLCLSMVGRGTQKQQS